MKKWIILLILGMLINAGVFGQDYNFNHLVGSWRTKDGAGLEVQDSFKIYIVYQDKKKMLVNYSTDFSGNPIRFNFVIREGSSLVNIKSEMLFVNDDLVQWRFTEPDVKPVSYTTTTPRKDVLILRRLEERTN